MKTLVYYFWSRCEQSNIASIDGHGINIFGVTNQKNICVQKIEKNALPSLQELFFRSKRYELKQLKDFWKIVSIFFNKNKHDKIITLYYKIFGRALTEKLY